MLNDEDRFYEIVAAEIRQNRIQDGLWTKAIAKSLGDENKTKAMYIQMRVEQLAREERSRPQSHPTEPFEPWESDEEEDGADASTAPNWKPHAIKAAEVLGFLLGLWLIVEYLWPWIRSIKSGMTP